jgi:hypothetical protein
MSGFLCYACSTEFNTISEIQCHLQCHNNLGELPCPIKCCQGTCRSTFTKVFNFVRHLKAYHNTPDRGSTDTEDPTASHETSTVDVFEGDSDFSGDLPCVITKNAVNCLADLKAEGTALVASLRANSSIPYGVIRGIIESFNHMLDRTVSSVHGEILKTVQKCGISDDDVRIVQTAMVRQAETLHEPLDFLATRYKQDKYFDDHPLAVKPETIVLDSASKHVQGNLL